MTDPIQVWVAPSARDLTRDYMIAQLGARTPPDTAPWSTGIPAQRPARFYTVEELNSTSEFGVIADAQMIQIRCYDTDRKALGNTMRLIKGLWKVMPAYYFVTPAGPRPTDLQVQDVEHAGGPSYDEDPDIDGLYYGQLIAWVTVMNTLF